ncbi:MAG: hypothetical protein AAB544_06045 [Patescibacteria group bacterium]
MFDAERNSIGTAVLEPGGGSDNASTSTPVQSNIEEEMKVGAEVHDEVHGRLPVDSDGYEHARNQVEA